MTQSVVLETAHPAAASTLARVNQDAFAGLAGRFWSVRDFEEMLSNANTLTILARAGAAGAEEGDVVGYAVLRHAADEAELLSIGVVPSRRGQGIGRCLVMEGTRRAEEAGARRLLLDVAETNRAALAFYTALGFYRAGRRADYYPAAQGEAGTASRPIAAILMSAALPLSAS